MSEDELQAILYDPAVEILIVRDGKQPVGFVELDFRTAGECEIAFFGLIPEQNGKGNGRWMMNLALDKAWRALPFYQRCGFRIFRQQTGRMADPRLTGHLPRTAAPHVPILS